jgi:hypothetical protein
MKKEIFKLLALLFFGAAALSGCAIENRGHDRWNNDRQHLDRNHHHDHDHQYRNY